MRFVSPARRRRFAIMEAGIALTATLLPAIEEVDYVTIVPSSKSPIGRTVLTSSIGRWVALGLGLLPLGWSTGLMLGQYNRPSVAMVCGLFVLERVGSIHPQGRLQPGVLLSNCSVPSCVLAPACHATQSIVPPLPVSGPRHPAVAFHIHLHLHTYS